MITATTPARLLAGAALLLLACAPPKISAEDDEAGTSSDSGEGSSSTDGSESESGGSSSSSTDESDTGVPFVPRHDQGTVNECDPFQQDCPEGEKCAPYSSTGGNWDAHKCVPVLGDQAPGEPCSYDGVTEATDNCDASSACWDVQDQGGELVGVCRRFCQGSADEPMCPDPPGCAKERCQISGDGIPVLCVPNCDPLADLCPEGTACFWGYDDFACIFTTEDIPPGEPCDYINDCAPGHACVPADELPECAGQNCCAPFCDPNIDEDPCPSLLAGTNCQLLETGDDACPVGLCRGDAAP